MSMIEVLQNCLTQKKDFLSTIGCIDPLNSNLVIFNNENYSPRHPCQSAFMIQVFVYDNNIHNSIVDEVPSTYIMSLFYWKAIGSTKLSQSPNTLKAFDG